MLVDWGGGARLLEFTSHVYQLRIVTQLMAFGTPGKWEVMVTICTICADLSMRTQLVTFSSYPTHNSTLALSVKNVGRMQPHRVLYDILSDIHSFFLFN